MRDLEGYVLLTFHSKIPSWHCRIVRGKLSENGVYSPDLPGVGRTFAPTLSRTCSLDPESGGNSIQISVNDLCEEKDENSERRVQILAPVANCPKNFG